MWPLNDDSRSLLVRSDVLHNLIIVDGLIIMLLASLNAHYLCIQISCSGNQCFVHLSWQ